MMMPARAVRKPGVNDSIIETSHSGGESEGLLAAALPFRESETTTAWVWLLKEMTRPGCVLGEVAGEVAGRGAIFMPCSKPRVKSVRGESKRVRVVELFFCRADSSSREMLPSSQLAARSTGVEQTTRRTTIPVASRSIWRGRRSPNQPA